MIRTVVKLGGGVVSQPSSFVAAVHTIRALATSERLVVVPGGGPFADAVRRVHGDLRLSDSAAHWMATLAMDQYAYLLVDRLPGARRVVDREGIERALDDGALPVLAPTRWLQEADPLPHSWDVTSDSIAAWLAGQLGAHRLVLIKPAGAVGTLVDPYFLVTLPPGVPAQVVTADRLHEITNLVGGDGRRS